MNRLRRLTISILLLLFSSQAWAWTEIINLRHWTAPEHTRVVIDTDEEIQFTVEKSASKVQLNLANSALSKGIPHEYILNEPGIARIAFSVPASGSVRLELFVTERVETKIFKLKKFQDKPHRLVVDITLPEVEKEESQAREQVKVVKKNKIIVIDPGHGGEDPGATGKRGTTEKNVVLAIGKKLTAVLNSSAGTRAFLTREGDYYVPFKKRLSIARELGADLFISIHADAARNRIAKGSSVYCLSTGGATSEAAKILARKENMADIIGGTLSEDNGSGESDPIILNMFQTNTINQSKNFGNKILDSLGRINDIKFPQVQEAPFRVLKFPEIPAILIETAYISNLQEESNLQDKTFQTVLAASIAGAVRGFFSIPESPPAEAVPAVDKIGRESKSPTAARHPLRPSVYKVKRGDTLIRIAGQYRTEVSLLLKLNKMKLNDPLYVDRVLALPVSEADRKDDPGAGKAEALKKTSRARNIPAFHKVSKGDTIIKIARQYQTSVSVLLKLNNMKLSDPLYIGRELRLPRPLS
jgi:N-acetylmuramoyl-L-alanine amidase